MKQESLSVIGLMSGTSMDGIDVVLVTIDQDALGHDRVQYIDSYMKPYPPEVRLRLIKIAEGNFGGSREIALMNSLIGRLYADCVEEFLTAKAIPAQSIDLIASHGQTLYHSLESENYLGYKVQSSLQLGEASYLAERFNCPVISDFRVRDIAAGGLGAPLVPFVDKKLYGSTTENLVYLNIGGISNITYIDKNDNMVLGFDTGPGNMLIDQAVVLYTNGEMEYDKDGAIAQEGTVSEILLERWLQEDYYLQEPPKNSGRENFGEKKLAQYKYEADDLGLSNEDFIRTLTELTVRCNKEAIERFCPDKPDRLVVSGGGSRNPLIMSGLAKALTEVTVESGDSLGYPNDAKEALSFAYLGYKTWRRECNTLPETTGAKHPVIMGKISF